jgi:hypothetical protein
LDVEAPDTSRRMPRTQATSFSGQIVAKHALQNYCFLVRNTLRDEKLREKFYGYEQKTVKKAVRETLIWLDKNQWCSKAVFEAKQKELESVISPIMTHVAKGLEAVFGLEADEEAEEEEEEDEEEESEEGEEEEDFELDESVSDEGHRVLSASDQTGLAPGWFDRLLVSRRAMRVAAGPQQPLGPPPRHLRPAPYLR